MIPASKPRLRIGRLPIDAVTFAEALDAIEALVAGGRGGSVFTPNVDHVVIADHDERLCRAYEAVSLSLVDGTPLLWVSRLLDPPLPEKISGSDLVEPLAGRAAARGWSVYLLGGGPGVAERAAAALGARHPGFRVIGAEGPLIDMEAAFETRRDVLQRVVSARPDIVFVALGNPKQELWVEEARSASPATVFVAVGAGLDFVAGTIPRAPRWMSAAGVEWLYRLWREPGRLWRRYLLRDPRFVLILLRTLRQRRARPREAAAPGP